MDVKYISSLLFVNDVSVSRHFYEKILDQEVALDHGECVTFSAGFSIMLRDYAHEVIYNERYVGQPSEHNFGVELYFETGDIVGTRDSLRELGVRFIHDIVEQPWGQRVLRVYDPDMYIVEVGEPMDIVIKRFISKRMSVEDVAARTSMPLDIVRRVAEQI
jgi:catechol 2,3-dioxygenase-like lactoylglutathione lyase family enzyme